MQWICRRFILFTFNLPCLPGPPGRIGSHIQKKTHPQVCLCLISGFLSILTVDFPSLLRSSVNLTFGRRWCVGPILRLILITFCLPYLLPHCGFSFTALQLGKSYVRKKAMQWICRRFTPPSSTALLFPRPSYTDTQIDITSTTLAGDGSSRGS